MPERVESGCVPPAARTNYFAVIGSNAAWAGDKPRTLADFRYQTSHTIMVVEVADSDIAWAEPTDFSLETALGVVCKSRTLALSSNHRPPDEFFYTDGRASGVNVAMADGSVQFLRTDNLSPDELRKILQIGGLTDEVMRSQCDLYAGRRLKLAEHRGIGRVARLGRHPADGRRAEQENETRSAGRRVTALVVPALAGRHRGFRLKPGLRSAHPF